MFCRGLQARDDKRQGTRLTMKMPQLCALLPMSILEVPEAKEALGVSLRVYGLMLAVQIKQL